MAIEIFNYKLKAGLTLKKSYIVISDINYKPLEEVFYFKADVCTEPDLKSSTNYLIEEGAFDVYINNFKYTGDDDWVEFTENLILFKINQVKDKTLGECQQHNRELDESSENPSWLEYWEYEYSRFNVTESSEVDYDEDDGYIEAGKILLGDE